MPIENVSIKCLRERYIDRFLSFDIPGWHGTKEIIFLFDEQEEEEDGWRIRTRRRSKA
jgi:hypothetical protein